MANPEAQNRSTTPMLDICAGSTLSEILRELRTTTIAFLTDRYYDGTYVATLEDIREMQETTAALLADLTDSRIFYGDSAWSDLLLPGEQFLLPASLAVDRVRSTVDAFTKPVSLGKECFSDAVVGGLRATEVQHMLPDKAKPTVLLSTIELDEQRHPPEEYRYVTLESLLDQPGGMDELLNFCEEAYSGDSDVMDTASDDAELTFDAPEAPSRFQASYAASFFDFVAGAVVPYASFDQLLEMDDGHTQLAHFQHASERDADGGPDWFEDIIDEHIALWMLMDDNNTRVDIDGIDAACSQFPLPPTARFALHDEPKIMVCSTTIWTQEPCPSALSPPVELAGRRVSLKSSELLQEGLLFKGKVYLLSQTDVGELDGFFANDVWTNSPNLVLALPASGSITELAD